ncbi:hypothetical protein [Marinobacter sp.]|uniref:hypothetical protein n=1 Tax=Marinobacter sp. TaxID=50741 RepID=UPI0019C1DB97|nr:hypothetical protein [Marinobacter sp.]MBD3657805.1 hypothetical protein [Marinobacter sp.]
MSQINPIPPRQKNVEDKDRRFYVCTPSSVYLKLQQEAITRGTDLWTLGGAVLHAWLSAGCPDFGFTAGQSESSVPPSSSSPLADDQGGEA